MGYGAGTDSEQKVTLLFRTPTGLADGLALKEMRYAGSPAIRPTGPGWVPAGSPIASATALTIRLGAYRLGSLHDLQDVCHTILCTVLMGGDSLPMAGHLPRGLIS